MSAFIAFGLFPPSTAADTSKLFGIVAPDEAELFTCTSYEIVQVSPESTEILEKERFGAEKVEEGLPQFE